MQSGIKVASIWSAGLLLGLALRRFLPALPGVFMMRKAGGIVLPLNRVAFWFCLVIGLVTGVVVMVRAMAQDLGLR